MILKYKKTIITANFDRELNLISERIEKLNLPKGFFEFIIYTISELLANVKEHAKTNKASLVLIINKKKCSIHIADRGIGLKQSYLLRQIYVKDDLAAIELAFSGLSTKNLQERGFGLYSIRKLVETLGSKLVVKTGLARAVIEKNRINFQKNPKKILGVSFNIESSIKRLDFYKIIK